MVVAAFVGVFLAIIISTLFYTCTFIGLVATLSDDQTTAASEPNDVLVLKINGPVQEMPSAMPFSFDMLSGFSLNESLDLQTIIQAIDVAEVDPNIAGIYLNTDNMSAQPATYEAIHNRFEEFKKSGKWIVSYNDNYTLGQYYLASMADSLFVNTIGTVQLDGMTSVVPYFKGLLDKLDVNVQIFRVGSFKSAVEPYMLSEMSDANRQQISCYLSSIWNVMATDIAAHLDVDVSYIDSLANLAVSYMTPEELATTGLVDAQIYKEDVESLILSMTGEKEFHGISAKALANNYSKHFPSAGKEKIAVLYAVGEILSEEGAATDGLSIYWPTIVKEIKALQKDDNVKAVVLRVNSPGGSAFASEQIWKALTELRDVKPLIVSMGDYAASGGYYISAPADYVFAEPNTLTGSIGVFGMIPDFSGLANRKLGVTFQEVKTHELGAMHLYRPATSVESEKIQKSVEHTYDLFLSRCAEGRAMEKDSIAVIAGGRVWTGRDALANGLVDELGGLSDAVEYAARQLGIENGQYYVDTYPKPEDSFQALFKTMSDDATIRMADYILGSDRQALDFLQSLKTADRVQARMFNRVDM